MSRSRPSITAPARRGTAWRMLPLILAAFLLGLLLSASLAAQTVPTQTLAAPTTEFEEPFTRVSGVRELSGGALIVGDARDQTLQRIDLASGSATAVGRRGSGPTEWDTPFALHAMPGDSTLVFDAMNQRYLVIGPDAKPAGTFTLGEGEGMMVGRRPRGVDAQGRLYYQGGAVREREGDGPPTMLDSVAIVRFDRKLKRHDTLAMIKGPDLKVGGSSSGNNRMVMIRAQPFAAGDDWGVTGDGRVALARSKVYGLDWISGGRRTRGANVAYKPIKVTAADKAEWEKRMRDARPIIRTVGGGGGRMPAPPPPSADDQTWPAVKPPFTGEAVQVSPEGEAWVMRTTPAGEKRAQFDVFDGQGRLARKVVLPPDTRLVGFGKGVAYLVRTDADGLEWLGRYRR